MRRLNVARTYARRHYIIIYICATTRMRKYISPFALWCVSTSLRSKVRVARIFRSNIFHEVAKTVNLQMECLLMHFFSLFYVAGMYSRCFTFRRETVRNPESNVSIHSSPLSWALKTLRKEEKSSGEKQNHQKRVTRLCEKMSENATTKRKMYFSWR